MFRDSCSCKPSIPKYVNVPIELYESMIGKYFIGYADDLQFGKETRAWAMLFNPQNSGVNLHVNVWTVTDISQSSYRAQFWFNASPQGIPIVSSLVTPSNTAIQPLPVPKVQLQQASFVVGEPIGGTKAFVRRALPDTTLVETENGKLIFPPGGTFLVDLSSFETPGVIASGRVAFGWWEENINYNY